MTAARRPVRARHPARGAGRRRRADRRAVLSDRGDADAVRDRPRSRAAGADRPGDPLARRAAREPARARPAVRGRPRGRLARPDPDGAARRSNSRSPPRRWRTGSPPACRWSIAAPLLGLLLNLDPTATGAVALTLLVGHAGADLHRPDRRGAHGDAAARRPAARGAGPAADDPGADLRRRGLERGDRRAGAVRHAVHASCAR